MSPSKLVCITGGIGCGKSTFAGILLAMGYVVFDSDSRAKSLMETDPSIVAELVAAFGTETFHDGRLDRGYLASAVFTDAAALARLNAIVHPAVRRDLLAWSSESAGLKFVETAIPYQSGIDKLADAIWQVSAPDEVRVRRIAARDGFSERQIAERMASQRFVPERVHPCLETIVNDGRKAVLPQLLALLERIK